jgi:hypothetical protein
VLAELLPDSPASCEPLWRRASIACASICCCAPNRPRRRARVPIPSAARFAPLEVNNGGSQGHWICSSVNDVLLAALGLEGKPVFDNPHALIVDVYEAFNAWLKERIGARRFRALFPGGRGAARLRRGPYSGRLVNDIEGPRIVDFIARGATAWPRVISSASTSSRPASASAWATATCSSSAAARRARRAVRGLERPLRDRLHGVLRGGRCARRTRARARSPQAVLRGHVLGISAWPGRELLENDKAHLVEKAHAAAPSASMGLSGADAALLQEAAPDAVRADRRAGRRRHRGARCVGAEGPLRLRRQAR